MNLQVTKEMKNALSNMSEGAFQAAGAILNESRESVREAIQDTTSSKMQEIINKLSNNSQILQEDIALIKLWIIGDAESYTQEENNLNDWIEEFKRLCNILANYENRNCNVGDLFKLSGLLEDAMRVSYDITNILQIKDRISKFELAVSDGLDQEERGFLVDFLSGKIRSREY
jgi:hypothetical protein